MQASTSSLDALAGALDAWLPDAIVSVHSPAWPVQPLPGVPHLRLSLNDAEWDGTTAFDGSLNRRGIEACTRFHVRRFLAFLHERAPSASWSTATRACRDPPPWPSWRWCTPA